MTRTGLLRAGYACFALAFASLGASAVAGSLLLVGLLLALIAAVLLVFSDDELPKWAGIVLVAYFVLIGAAFLLATPITIRRGGNFGLEPPNPQLASTVLYYLGLASPLLLAGTALAAAWERERSPRLLLMGALGGFVVVALLTVAVAPSGTDPDAIARATSQGNLLRLLFSLSSIAATVGAAWSAARPEEYA